MIESAARGAQFLLAIGIAYLIALWFALVAWTFRDIESRSRSVFTQVFSTLLVVLFFVPGLMLYLILRPKETLDQAFQRALEEEYLLQDLDDLPLCPGCQRTVDAEYVLCPHCQTHLRGPCPSCTRLVDLRWSVCPYCAVPIEPNAITVPGAGGQPALEEGREGRRKRAVAAAAERVGIEGDELDALNEALAGAGRHAAVGAGGLSRRITAGTDFSRPFSGVRARIAQFGQSAPVEPETPGPNGETEPTTDREGATTARFWADPLPRTTREAEETDGR